ncbi:hypothetical protein [Vibrio crassostreae]|uniref:hypothetical protein n=1 Tax=Vibrio crassostreae TaxID=246167 RepID=UPI00070B0367|nr:hypothetical protein [Vibrio crassostreae]TCT56226.1 hypothetical protein EDB44_13046 [Vibrio crassostreae]TCT67695.1 hypothetical protein EDB46_1233 [Vibrio crassostreae]TCT76352.1 hypothetical protein EDB43_1303 [Vibrio crassostreae]TCT97173.1 hypothetical protein EDB47_1343 [Vibrio crassostreae]TDW02400.1 hypothetical protein EDB45_1303 [Vibrio crassostreae]
MKQQDLTDWTSIPAATARQRFPCSRYNKTPTFVEALSLNMVPAGDLTGLASKPTRWISNSHNPKATKGRYKSELSLYGTGLGGLIGQAFLPPPRRQCFPYSRYNKAPTFVEALS